MFCELCNCLHRRTEMKRSVEAARYCSKCSVHHKVLENDLWSEVDSTSTQVHYYSYIDGAVYNVTEWVLCKKMKFEIEPNGHEITFKMYKTTENTSTNGKTKTLRKDYKKYN
jgi:hypothetical protein